MSDMTSNRCYVVLVRPDGVGPPGWPHWWGPPIGYSADPEVFESAKWEWCAIKRDGDGWSAVIGEDTMLSGEEIEAAIEDWWTHHDQAELWQWQFQLLRLRD